MSNNYLKNASSNRDALFGDVAPKKKTTTKSSAAAPSATASSAPAAATTAKGYNRKPSAGSSKLPSLSVEAKAAKLKEAEEYKEKANKCMERGFFKKPDPVAASTFFKRAADAYQAAGEAKLESMYRVSSGETNMMCGAWASAASDYTRAAELILSMEEDDDDNDLNRRRSQAVQYHQKAAEAWTQLDEKSKAAASQMQAAICLLQPGTRMSREALTQMEAAVEAHVPDPLNPYARYRQTGTSAYLDPDSDETIQAVSSATKALAQQALVTRAYAHEPVQEVMNILTEYGEYPSALYAAGGVSVILEAEGVSTLSLSRAFVVETILTLAMGDPILAEQMFLNRHVQKTFYLKSRECQLAEELYRAIKNRDPDALDQARSISGPNRAALANLPHDSLRALVQELRVSGVARKKVPETTAANPQLEDKPLQEILSQKTGYEKEVAQGADLNAHALTEELDALDFGGLSDSEDGGGVADGGDDELDGLEDDDVDLR